MSCCNAGFIFPNFSIGVLPKVYNHYVVKSCVFGDSIADMVLNANTNI